MRVKSNLDTIIYDHIVDSLICGEYKMGQKILLDEFAEKYEVSRTPVIQAVKLLANDGLLETMSNGRIVVPSFEYEQIKEVCETRLLIEQYAIKKILDNYSESVSLIEALEISAAKCKRQMEDKEYLELTKTDLRFHRLLVDAAHNEFLSEIYRRVQGRFIVANYLVLPLEKRDFAHTVNDHFLLIEYLKNNDLEKAIEFIQQHINNICNIIINRED